MRIILTKQCESLTGSLGRGYGYFIQRRGAGFFSQRSKHQPIPSDGHWRFIVKCAEMAGGLHIADIEVSEREMRAALDEAQLYGFGPVGTYNARRVLEAKQWFIDHENKN